MTIVRVPISGPPAGRRHSARPRGRALYCKTAPNTAAARAAGPLVMIHGRGADAWRNTVAENRADRRGGF